MDLNKLLVPTQAHYDIDSLNENLILIRGIESKTLVQGIYQSFYDAPGVLQADGSYSVAREELSEISLGLGAEY